jgi:hypothetical protein
MINLFDFYWLYELSNLSLFFLIVGFVTMLSLAKPLFFPDYFEKKWNVRHQSNDFIIGFLTLTGAFMSITMGLIAVGTFETYKSSSDTVNSEASSLAVLYQNVHSLQKPEKLILENKLKDYARFVIDTAWEQQQNGIIPIGGNRITQEFNLLFHQYKPESERDIIYYREIVSQYNQFYLNRRMRLSAVQEGLPASIYFVLIIGLMVNIVISWQIKIDNRPLEIFTGALTGILAGSLVFIIVAMDNPFRGEFSVGSDPFQVLLSTIMK